MSTDTSPAVQKYIRRRYSEMSGAERVAIGSAMFGAARAMVLASFPPGLSEHEIRQRLCERFYGSLASQVYGKHA